MGFGFRKTFSSGPFRFTISPGGISSSFGIRGARVTKGPRGTFVTVSSHGVYYRHRIDTPAPRVSAPAIPQKPEEEVQLDSVFHVPVAELVGSSQNELVAKLNQNLAAINPAFIPLILSGLLLFEVPSSPGPAAAAIIFGFVLAAFLARRFKQSHTHEIHYSLDSDAARSFEATQRAVQSLGSCSRIWVLNTSAHTADYKRHAGAGTLITRRSASAGILSTRGFKSSLPISSIEANGTVFHFLPDQVLILIGKRYASISYSQLLISIKQTRFIEEQGVPSDSRCVDTTWRFVNKNGGPDRRFNNNRQIPVLQYGEVTLRTASGLQVILQTSNVEKAQAFAARFTVPERPATSRNSQTEPAPKMPVSKDASLLQCYALLGLVLPTTLEKAAVAHREKAALYHPDKYEHLAPEMKELAVQKMAEINIAYQRVKEDLGR